MEEGTKGRKWRVTYTKHLKQKRKVYHDGFLELSASGDKVRYYCFDLTSINPIYVPINYVSVLSLVN